jgi:prepilin-type N-terminal cleavage/methylation domain-containing protein
MFARRRRLEKGFTLIETLVVLVISVGLVITMGLLFRAVAHTTLILRGSNDEWALQTRLREQLRHILTLPGEPPLSGDQKEVTFTTWKSQRDGHAGKPVIAQYRYEAAERSVYYRENELPAWWSKAPKFAEIRSQLAQAPETRLASGIDDLRFEFIAAEATDLKPASLKANWQQADMPRIMVLNFTRAARPYTLYLQTGGLAAQTGSP